MGDSEQITPKTKQVEGEATIATAKQKQQEEEVLAQLLETAKPDIKQYKRRVLLPGILIPVILLVVFLVEGYIGWREWRPTLELGAAALTVMGTVVIVLAALPTRKTAALMSTTRWDGNRYLLAELLKNRLAAWAGLVLILLGFLFQSAVFALERLNID